MEISGKLLMSHIADILDIVKYDSGQLTLRPVDLNFSMLIQDVIDNQKEAAFARHTKIGWEWTGTPVDWIHADRDIIQHILMNVIGNAVKFTHGGKVSVTLQADGEAGDLEITVRDTGIGIERELQAKIFDDFMTGDSSYGRVVGGTGLGLGLARRFVKALDGTIDVKSEVGFGSVFRIRFPIKRIDPPQKTVGKPIVQAQSTTPRTVLLVEDNEINRVVAREMLRAAGHSVTEAHNGREAVDIAQDQAFDLILMDISMPVLDGRHATREIRAGQGKSAETPIVALTANAMAEEQAAYLSDGMVDVLAKPLSRAALMRIVSTVALQSEPTAPEAASSQLSDLRDMLGVIALQKLLTRFKDDVEQVITLLSNDPFLDAADVKNRTAKIASSAAYFGAFDLRQALLAVDEAAQAEDQDAMKSAIAALPRVWKTCLPMLEA
jgi:CheY-like chemotaxis protein/anti-sigma regulatory factor (Ser/Thr protein kinase)